MRASIAASATAEPETPPIRALSRMATCASPPRIQPVRTVDRRISRSVIPDSFIRWPANTNSGTASSGKDCVMLATFWIAISVGTGPKM